MSDSTLSSDNITFLNSLNSGTDQPIADPPNNSPADTSCLYLDYDIPINRLELELNLYKELDAAADVKNLEERVLKKVKRCGFPHFAFLHLLTVHDISGKPVVVPTVLLKSYPDEAVFQGDIHPPHEVDKITAVKHADLSVYYRFVATAPCVTRMPGRKHECYLLMTNVDYYDYYIVASGMIPSETDQDHGGLAFSLNPSGKGSNAFHKAINRNKQTLGILARIIAHIGGRKFPDVFRRGEEELRLIKIPPKPSRLLNVLAKEDLPLYLAADRMCISVDTANKHMAILKKRLGVRTQAGAVYRAMKAGLLD